MLRFREHRYRFARLPPVVAPALVCSFQRGGQMARMNTARAGVFAVAGVLLLASAARAQEAGSAGVVKDNTGAVLPGVTVTVASPVRIEKERVVITDTVG